MDLKEKQKQDIEDQIRKYTDQKQKEAIKRYKNKANYKIYVPGRAFTL
jgi:hypothetical protein